MVVHEGYRPAQQLNLHTFKATMRPLPHLFAGGQRFLLGHVGPVLLTSKLYTGDRPDSVRPDQLVRS